MRNFWILLFGWMKRKQANEKADDIPSPDPAELAVAHLEVAKHFKICPEPYRVPVVYDDSWEIIDFWRYEGGDICLEADVNGELHYVIYELPAQ